MHWSWLGQEPGVVMVILMMVVILMMGVVGVLEVRSRNLSCAVVICCATFSVAPGHVAAGGGGGVCEGRFGESVRESEREIDR